MPSMRGYLRHRARLIRQADAEFARAIDEKKPFVAAAMFATAAKLYKHGELGLSAAMCYANAAVLCRFKPPADEYWKAFHEIGINWDDYDEDEDKDEDDP